ncbi:MAG TPA: YwqG family protein [Kofleriaceae bacterium]|nr:YwqG family protein [Kofleriaceae bacterium]
MTRAGARDLPDRKRIDAALRALPVRRDRMDLIVADLKPSARLLRRPERRHVTGVSRLGGIPDLSAGIAWPSYARQTDRDGPPRISTTRVPLDFIAQVRLDDVPPEVLPQECPTTGLLSFFYDCEEAPWGFDPLDRGGGQVLYQAPQVELAPTLPPPEVRERTARACTALPGAEWTAPAPDGYLSHDEVIACWDDLTRVISRWPKEREHRLLGHSQNIQNEMTLECQIVSSGLYFGDGPPDEHPEFEELAGGAKDWILLLQVDTDDGSDGPGWMWGDCGRIYFWIRRQDLAARRFERTWTVLQCT